MGQCSVCKNEFEDKYFDDQQDKCILHRKKNTSYQIDENFENR